MSDQNTTQGLRQWETSLANKTLFSNLNAITNLIIPLKQNPRDVNDEPNLILTIKCELFTSIMNFLTHYYSNN